MSTPIAFKNQSPTKTEIVILNVNSKKSTRWACVDFSFIISNIDSIITNNEFKRYTENTINKIQYMISSSKSGNINTDVPNQIPTIIINGNDNKFFNASVIPLAILFSYLEFK